MCAKELPGDPAEMTDEQWQATLEPVEFRVLRKGGTEQAFSGELVHEKRDGTFRCAGCGHVLFASDAKFDSGSGWPSFVEPADEEHVTFHEDRSHGMVRTEVRCARCDGHLGHVFEDGPEPTGLRYCINSAALEFEEPDDD